MPLQYRYTSKSMTYPEQEQYIKELASIRERLSSQLAAAPTNKIPFWAKEIHSWISDEILVMTGQADPSFTLAGTPFESLATSFASFAENAGAISADFTETALSNNLITSDIQVILQNQKNNLNDMLAQLQNKLNQMLSLVNDDVDKTDDEQSTAGKSYVYTRKASNYKYKAGDRVTVKPIKTNGRILSIKRINGTGKIYYTVKLDTEDKPVVVGTNDLVKMR